MKNIQTKCVKPKHASITFVLRPTLREEKKPRNAQEKKIHTHMFFGPAGGR